MTEYVTFFYLIKLAVFAGLLFITFYGFGQLISKKAPLLSGVDGGFITFLAINEILSLPFILLHLSFELFFVVFMAINIPLFVYGAIQLFKNPARILRRTDWLYIGLATLSLVVCIGLTQFYVKYDADDSFYVSLVQQNRSSSQLYTWDPSTGDHSLPLSRAYMFEGWELIESALSKSFGLSSLELTHGLIPIVAIVVVFAALYKIYKDLSSNNQLSLVALALLGVILIFSGYSLYSQGTFLLTRSWQGKALVANLIIPMLLFALYKAYKAPARHGSYLAVLLINIAAIALNPSSIFLCFAAITTFGLLILARSRSWRPILALGLSLSPILIVGAMEILTLNGYGSGGFDTEVPSSYSTYFKRFIGSSWYFYFWVAGLVILFRAKPLRKGFAIFYMLPILLLLTFLNPLFTPLIKHYASGNTYWRLFWLLPLTIALPLLAAKLSFLPSGILKSRTGTSLKHFVNAMSVSAVTIILIVSGSFMFDTSRPLVACDNTRAKVPVGVEGVGNYLNQLPYGKVLASTDPAAYLHSFTSKHALLVSRSLQLSVYYPKTSTGYADRMQLFGAVSGTDPLPSIELQKLLRKYKVNYLVYPSSNLFVSRYVSVSNLAVLYSSSFYKVAEVK